MNVLPVSGFLFTFKCGSKPGALIFYCSTVLLVHNQDWLGTKLCPIVEFVSFHQRHPHSTELLQEQQLATLLFMIKFVCQMDTQTLIRIQKRQLDHLLTHTLTHSHTHSLTHSFTHSLIHSLIGPSGTASVGLGCMHWAPWLAHAGFQRADVLREASVGKLGAPCGTAESSAGLTGEPFGGEIQRSTS